MKKREIWQYVENDTDLVTCVPLNKEGAKGTALVDPADYDELMKRGVSGNWYRTSNGHVGVAVRGKNELVARLLLNLGPKEVVRFVDENPLNLRRANLEVRQSTGAWKPRVCVRPERSPSASDIASWVDWTGSQIAGQNAFNSRSTDFKNKPPAGWRK